MRFGVFGGKLFADSPRFLAFQTDSIWNPPGCCWVPLRVHVPGCPRQKKYVEIPTEGVPWSDLRRWRTWVATLGYENPSRPLLEIRDCQILHVHFWLVVWNILEHFLFFQRDRSSTNQILIQLRRSRNEPRAKHSKLTKNMGHAVTMKRDLACKR